MNKALVYLIWIKKLGVNPNYLISAAYKACEDTCLSNSAMLIYF